MQKQNSLVIDSSVAVKWLIIKDELYIGQADKVLKDLKAGFVELFMPELVKYEIGNVLLNKKLTLNDIKRSIALFYKIPIKFNKEDVVSSVVTAQIAFKYGITYYDASFIALAQKLEATLITDNPKHQNKYKGKEIKIISLKNYDESSNIEHLVKRVG